MTSEQTVSQAWRDVRDRLASSGIDGAPRDAKLLAGHAFGSDTLGMTLDAERPISTDEAERLDALTARRISGEPVARIIGEKEFYGLPFGLNGATLVPRPETELLVDLGLDLLKGRKAPRILDLGTGTGCIVISQLSQIPTAKAVAIDLSQEALTQAEANARRHGVGDRLTLIQGNWFDQLSIGDGFDLIVSNPPYIESDTISELDRDVREHDPHLALDGGPDGLAPYREICGRAPAHLLPGGALLVEIGQGRAADVAALMQMAGFDRVSRHRDLAGIERALLALG